MSHPTLPIQVYLDSSDYSRFARGEFVDCLNRLRTWAQSREIEVRLSGAHIAEAAPTAEAHLRYAAQRFLCMKELSAGHCLISPDDVATLEARVLFGFASAPIVCQRESGNWLPDSILKEIAFPSREQLVREGIATLPLPRAGRRTAMRRLFTTGGTLTAEGERQFAGAAVPMLERIRSDFPVSEAAEARLSEYMSGRCDGAAVFAEIIRSLADLEIFAKWLCIHWAEVHPVTTWIREAGQSLAASSAAIVQRANALWESGRLAGLSDSEIRRMRDNALRESVVNMGVRLARSSGGVDADVPPVGDLWTLAPGISVAAAALVELARRATAQPGQSRPIRPSDAGDVIHCFYLPYVDLFRADAFMASALSQAAPQQYRARIIDDLQELPTRIESALQARSAIRGEG